PAWRAVQITTSGWRWCGPPNPAASGPSFVSTTVEAWLEAKGAVSKMNSDFTRPGWRSGDTDDTGCAMLDGQAASQARARDRRVNSKFISSARLSEENHPCGMATPE